MYENKEKFNSKFRISLTVYKVDGLDSPFNNHISQCPCQQILFKNALVTLLSSAYSIF